MTGIFLALLLFATIAVVGGTLLTKEQEGDELMDAPRRLPNPGARDQHAVGATLGRAPVPSWG